MTLALSFEEFEKIQMWIKVEYWDADISLGPKGITKEFDTCKVQIWWNSNYQQVMVSFQPKDY